MKFFLDAITAGFDRAGAGSAVAGVRAIHARAIADMGGGPPVGAW